MTCGPVLPSHVRVINGEVVQTFARERRVVLEYEEYPRQMIEAFLAAEDRTFFQHSGIDYPGILRAVITNLTSSRSEEHTSELQSLMRISYAVFCLKKKIIKTLSSHNTTQRETHTTNNYHKN